MRYLLFAASVLIFTSPAAAKWHVAQSDHFVVYSDDSSDKTAKFAEQLERFDAAMRTMHNMPPETESNGKRLTIYRFGTTDDIASLAGDPRSGIAGFFIPRANGSVAFVPSRQTYSGTPGIRDENDSLLNSRIILFHEYTHYFMFKYFPAAYPAWYVEGFAEVYATADFLDDGSFRIGEPANHRGQALFYDTPYPVKDLFQAKQRPGDTRFYYTIGWLLTHYLTFTPSRAGQLKKYLVAVNSGVPSDVAAKQAFGDLDQLNSDIQKYKTSRLIGIQVKPAHPFTPKVTTRELTDAEGAIIMAKIHSDRGVDKKSAPGVAAEARQKARAYPADPFVQNELAEAELDAGNLDAAEAAADRSLAADPTAVDALIYKGDIRMKRAKKDRSQFAEARNWFIKANRENPDNPEPLIGYYLTFEKAGERPPEIAILGLQRAFELARFDGSVRVLLARQLLTEGRAKPARTLLGPVAYSAHGGKLKDAAAKAIEQIDSNNLQAAIATADKQLEDESES
jgi:tetratricopeptide (TPR) repeat protein